MKINYYLVTTGVLILYNGRRILVDNKGNLKAILSKDDYVPFGTEISPHERFAEEAVLLCAGEWFPIGHTVVDNPTPRRFFVCESPFRTIGSDRYVLAWTDNDDSEFPFHERAVTFKMLNVPLEHQLSFVGTGYQSMEIKRYILGQANLCIKCGSIMHISKALDNTLVAHSDFGGDAGNRGTTQSKEGPAILVPVWKCEKCGHSYTL